MQAAAINSNGWEFKQCEYKYTSADSVWKAASGVENKCIVIYMSLLVGNSHEDILEICGNLLKEIPTFSTLQTAIINLQQNCAA